MRIIIILIISLDPMGRARIVNALPDSWLAEKFSDRLPYHQPQGKLEGLLASDRQCCHETGEQYPSEINACEDLHWNRLTVLGSARR